MFQTMRNAWEDAQDATFKATGAHLFLVQFVRFNVWVTGSLE
jgi:hypothetical protein